MTTREWTFEQQTCVGVQCPTTEPVNDMCPNATVAAPEPGEHAFSITYNTICAHTDGPDGRDRPWQIRDEGGSAADFGREVWYKYVATCTGFLQISTCGVGSNYDNMIGVFRNSADPKSCDGCPEDPNHSQAAGSDESCNSLHDGGSGFVFMTVTKGDCFLIAAGGWAEDAGPGKVDMECQAAECIIADPPQAEEKLPDYGFGTRNRMLGFSVKKDPKRIQAIRVTVVDIKDGTPHEICEGQQKWVGPPRKVCELSGEPEDCVPGYWVAPLVDEPHYTYWNDYMSVQVYDEQIVPESEYHIQAIDVTCALGSEANYSAPLVVRTSRFGNTVGTYSEDFCRPHKENYVDCWSPPEAPVDFDDISSTVAKFKNSPGAPQKSRADVAPGIIDFKVDFSDIPWVVDGFRALPYPADPPAKCFPQP
jgi:hypothetical protein